MKIYNYDVNNKNAVVNNEEATENPLVPGDFLIPANATDIEPPVCDDSLMQCFDVENKVWILLANFVGTKVYDKQTLEKSTISELGDIPENKTTSVPPKQKEFFSEVYWDGTSWHEGTYIRSEAIEVLYTTYISFQQANIDENFMTELNLSRALYENPTTTIKPVDLPQAVETLVWVETLWVEYYTKKAKVLANDINVDVKNVIIQNVSNNFKVIKDEREDLLATL